jgi:hypothetical protein
MSTGTMMFLVMLLEQWVVATRLLIQNAGASSSVPTTFGYIISGVRNSLQ